MFKRNSCIIRKSTNMRLNIHQRPLEKTERNISGLIVERYELLPRWWEVIDNSP